MGYSERCGRGSALLYIADAVDDDLRADRAAERAMRCARHVTECREERDAAAAGGWTRLRRARRRMLHGATGGAEGADGCGTAVRRGKQPAAPPTPETLREAALRRSAAR